MRRLILLALLVAVTRPVPAARRVTVADLQHILASQKAANKADADIAHQLSSLELTERLTLPTLTHITTDLKPGAKTIEALGLLADTSALLVPPPGEIPASPKPDMATQRAIFKAAITYVAGSLHRLPDFLATRVTHSFDNGPLVIGHSGYAPLTDLHLVGTFIRKITYRTGREVLDTVATTSASKSKPDQGPAGLTTNGEFGPVLAIILTDATKGTVTWSRWEHASIGMVAVFHYGVPKAASHYRVDYCCSWQAFDNGSGEPLAYHGTPGYHGELHIDPSTGAILRVTLEAELSESDAVSRAAIAVDYGTVEIDGKTYICPVHSVALSSDHSRPGKVIGGDLQVARVNDVRFVDYHKFGSTARIFADNETPSPVAAPTSPEAAAGAASAPAPAPTTPAAADGSIAKAAPVDTAPQPAALPADTPSTSAYSNPPEPAEDKAQADQESVLRQMPVYKATTREVVVDVVVTKSNGDPVFGLNKQDFAVQENGKPQPIDFFEEHTAKTLPAASQQPLPKLPPDTYTNVPPAPESDAVNVLLLDSLNTPKQDQSRVHNEIMDFFKKMQPGTRVAIFMLGSKLRFIQGFTTDTSILLAALNDKRNSMEPQKDSSLHDRSDQADDAADIQRLRSMFPSGLSSAGIDAMAQAQAETAAVGYGERASMTFEALNHLARYLAGVPGRKNLIWFSSTFPVIIFPNVAQRQQLANLRGYIGEVKKTADLFTVSKVAVYPVGAEGVMEEHIMEADTAGPGSPEGGRHMGSMDTMAPYNKAAGEGSNTIAAMEQLAADTGGKAYFNTNDLNGAMRRAINDGSNYYTISYSPTDKKMDGMYRKIEVRIPGGHYKLSYRRGYNADDLPALQAESKIDPLQPLLKPGLPSASGVLYGVRIVPATPQPEPNASHAGQNPNLKGPFTRYSVTFFIRYTDVALDLGAKGDHTGKIQVGLMAYDRDGKPVNWEGGTQTMNIEPAKFEAIQKSGIPAQMEIDLPNEDVTVVTGVYDWGSAKAGTLPIPLHPAAAAATAHSSTPRTN